METTAPQASIVIATYNRKDELRKAIDSCLMQDVAVEVIVVDDGSADGTAEMMRRDFPELKFIQSGPNHGPSHNRNLGVERSSCEIVFKIDDDAVFLSRKTVRQTLVEFDHPRVATLAIPFHEAIEGDQLKHVAPEAEGLFIISRYIGCSMAVRREAYLAVGGYNRDLFNMSEEADLCLKLLNLGYVTRLGRADPMRHHKSSLRDSQAIEIRIRRNALIRCWSHVPLRYLAQAMLGQIVMFLTKWRGSAGWYATLVGLGQGIFGVLRHPMRRRPVSTLAYRAWLKLRQAEPVILSQFESELPEIRNTAGVDRSHNMVNSSPRTERSV